MMREHPVHVCLGGEYKKGDPRPEGYLAFHAWADAQVRAGLKQIRCPTCSRWVFPQEKCDHKEKR